MQGSNRKATQRDFLFSFSLISSRFTKINKLVVTSLHIPIWNQLTTRIICTTFFSLTWSLLFSSECNAIYANEAIVANWVNLLFNPIMILLALSIIFQRVTAKKLNAIADIDVGTSLSWCVVFSQSLYLQKTVKF